MQIFTSIWHHIAVGISTAFVVAASFFVPVSTTTPLVQQGTVSASLVSGTTTAATTAARAAPAQPRANPASNLPSSIVVNSNRAAAPASSTVAAPNTSAESLGILNSLTASQTPSTGVGESASIPANTTLCNGVNYSFCPAGQDFVCPASGGKAYCQLPAPSPTAQQQTVSTAPPNSTLCNGTYYSACATGATLICPSSGAASCQPSAATVQAQQQALQQQAEQEQQAQEAQLAPLEAQYTQVIGEINTGCNNADAGIPVTTCELTESKIQGILEQEAAIGISTQEAAPELSELQNAYNTLQSEYYASPSAETEAYYVGTRNNIASEMQILATDESMFSN